MTTGERRWLYLSIVLSTSWWIFIYGVVIGSIFTFSLLFHEYGHYYWMGREGIKEKKMMMVPPFGAIAIAKEPWPSLGSEARIALAGPGFGFISALTLILVWLISGSYAIRIAIFLVCLVNLFNLCLPIAVLDGGRVIKSILLSLNTKLGIGFYYFSFIVLGLFVIKSMSIFMILIGFMIYNILSDDFQFTRYKINSGEPLIAMSGFDMFIYVGWYLIITAGLAAILIQNNLGYTELFNFIRLG